VRLTGVVVRNAGIEWGSSDNCYWQHKVTRKEAARIVLHGQSEFEASHVVLEGDQTFEVKGLPPDFGNGQMACGLHNVMRIYANIRNFATLAALTLLAAQSHAISLPGSLHIVLCCGRSILNYSQHGILH